MLLQGAEGLTYESSEAAMEITAEHIDVFLTWGESQEQVAKKIAKVKEYAAVGSNPASPAIRAISSVGRASDF